ncbi:MAG: cytochrome c biogenesis protein CcsA [Methylococcaceae bacterium]|nr:cytochrome c biogenesis protein CcsA [Methylococcaceae bacterium]
MSTSLFGVYAIIAYLAATATLTRSLQTDYIAASDSALHRLKKLGLSWLAAVLHGASLIGLCDGAGNVNFSFMSVSSLAALCIVAVLLLASLTKPVDKLGVIIFPLTAFIILLKLALPGEVHILKTHSWKMDVHILTSMLAYSFLNIAALQAVLVAVQDWRLRTHHATSWMRSLPPLQTMEKLLFQLIGAGFALLSVSLLTGFLFVENLFAQHLVHKTALSILAWLVFAVLLAGRAWQGWRGRTAIRWTLGGFASLMLAYFGSKMVLEWILNRH